MITITIILAVYLLSAYGYYKWVQEAYYSRNRFFVHLKPEKEDIFITFFPLVNTIACIIYWLCFSPYKPKEPKEINFFKPKNK